jgi:hypothetical protein
MTPLASEAMRARRRPGVIAVVFGLKLLGAGAVGLPIGAAVLGTGVTQWPGGDAVLWEPGGGLLGELVWNHPWVFIAALRASGWLALLAAGLGLLPLIALMVALSNAGRLGWSSLAARTVEHLGAFAALAGMTVAAQGVLMFAAGLFAVGVHRPLAERWGERGSDLTGLGVLALAGLGVLVLGILEDLARAVVVRARARLRTALPRALTIARRHAWSILGAYLPRALWSLALLVGAAAVVLLVRLDRPDTWRVGAAFFVHQTAAFGLVWLRASWLSRALACAPEPAETEGDGGGGAAVKVPGG